METNAKICSSCKLELDLSQFYRCRSNKDGLQHRCKVCQTAANHRSRSKKTHDERKEYGREYMIAWRAANPDRNKQISRNFRAKNIEKARRKTREWQIKNPEKARAATARWKSNNIDRVRSSRNIWMANSPEQKQKMQARVTKWKAENPEKYRELMGRMAAKRRMAEKRATPIWYDQEQAARIYALAAEITESTGIPHQVDHVIPLRSKWVSGLHWHGNMEVITANENHKKNNRHWPDMTAIEARHGIHTIAA